MNYTERNKLLDKISIIGLMLIGVELFLYATDYCYTKRFDVAPNMPVVLNVVGILFLVVSLGIFIYSYKKEKPELIIYGCEFLVLAFVCPLITYWYYPKAFGLTTNWFHGINHKFLWLFVLIYYVVRATIAIVSAYLNSNERKLKKRKA